MPTAARKATLRQTVHTNYSWKYQSQSATGTSTESRAEEPLPVDERCSQGATRAWRQRRAGWHPLGPEQPVGPSSEFAATKSRRSRRVWYVPSRRLPDGWAGQCCGLIKACFVAVAAGQAARVGKLLGQHGAVDAGVEDALHDDV